MNAWPGIIERLREQYGLAPRPAWGDDLNRALETLARDGGGGVRDALERALRHPGVLRNVAARLTIDETHFFRHPQHFEILVTEALRRLRAGRDVSVCSLGCAHGEEPFSIVIALVERLTPTELGRVSIVASDLNADSIARARRGVFSAWSARGLTPLRREQHFRELPSADLELSEALRAQVEFFALSAQEHVQRLLPASVDFIFFRNVGIYFEAQGLNDLYRQFATVLRDDGLLFTAPADPAPRSQLFGSAAEDMASVLHKTDQRFPPRPASAPVAPVGPRAEASGGSTAPTLADVRRLADRGDLAGALAASGPGAAAPGEGPALRVLRGQLHLAVGEHERSVATLAGAVFDHPDDLVARFWYAMALIAAGTPRRALFQVNALVERLAALHHDALLSDGCTRAADLLAATIEMKGQLI